MFNNEENIGNILRRNMGYLKGMWFSDKKTRS